MDRLRFRMFIDDTGDIRNAATNHPQQRFAGVVGVIFEFTYLRETFEPGFDQLRQRHFGRRDDGTLPILHLRKMKQANLEGPFGRLADPANREAWERDCMSMYRRAAYHVIAICVDKIAFYARHPGWQGSVYELLVGNAIERYFYFLRDRGAGDIVAEATNSALDVELKCLYRRFYENGTDHAPAASLQSVLTSREMKIKPKSANIAGLQMADLLASTCFSHCKRIYARGPTFDPFAMAVAQVIECEKFYRNPSTNDPHGYGRVWRPSP